MEKQGGEYRARFLASKVHCATLAQHLERSKDTKVHSVTRDHRTGLHVQWKVQAWRQPAEVSNKRAAEDAKGHPIRRAHRTSSPRPASGCGALVACVWPPSRLGRI